MYEAMRLGLARLQGPGTGRRARWITTEEALRAATDGSARALGLAKQIGRIEPGYKADIVFLDLQHINWIPMQRSGRTRSSTPRTAPACTR